MLEIWIFKGGLKAASRMCSYESLPLVECSRVDSRQQSRVKCTKGPIRRGVLAIRAAEKPHGLSKKLRAENPHEPQWSRGVKDRTLLEIRDKDGTARRTISLELVYSAKGETNLASTTSKRSPLDIGIGYLNNQTFIYPAGL